MDDFDLMPDEKYSWIGCLLCIASAVLVVVLIIHIYRWVS